MNVDQHAVSLVAVHRRRHHHQSVAAHKVADASLLLGVLAAGVGEQVELEGVGGADKQQQAAEPAHGREGLERHWPVSNILLELEIHCEDKKNRISVVESNQRPELGEGTSMCSKV